MAIYIGTNEVSLAGTNGGFMLNGRLLTTKTYTLNLSDTNYSSLELSTATATLTLPATTYTTSGTVMTCFRIGNGYDNTPIDFNNHDYVGFAECVINYDYGDNQSAVEEMIHGIRSSYTRDYQEGRYHQSFDATTGLLTSPITKSSSYIQSCNPLLYQKANGQYAVTTNQGLYHSGSGAISWSTNNNYVELKLGQIVVKGHDSYCPVAALNLIDPTTTTINMT